MDEACQKARMCFLVHMVLELHPTLHELSAEDKLRLSEELCMDVILDSRHQPALAALVRERLQQYRDEPESGIRWEDLKQKLLTRQAS